MESTPLHWPASGSFFNAVAMLLAAGADPNARNRFGATPLHIAATWHTDAAMIRALIDSGADVRAQDLSGAAPLHRAAYWSTEPEVVATLLAAGAAPAATDSFGDTPRHFAAAALRGALDHAASGLGTARPRNSSATSSTTSRRCVNRLALRRRGPVPTRETPALGR